MSLLPEPPRADAVGADDLSLTATTVYLEGASEPDEGKVGIAWVIRNLMDRQKRTARQVILGPEGIVDADGHPYEVFSCWNDDYIRQRTARLVSPDPVTWERCWRAAAGAIWRLLPDPTAGAKHYLNVELTRKIRPLHDLPSWYDAARVTARIGQHTFLA
jgi:spore germination cell wall hydrolase CwlJ-like protein